MKKLTCLLLCVLLIFPLTAMATLDAGNAPPPEWLAGFPYRVWINGEYISPDVPPEEADGEFLVPLRTVLEGVGVPLTYDAAAHTALITARDGEALTLDLHTGSVAGHGVYKMLIQNGRTLIDSSFFELIGGLSIADDTFTKTAIVTDSTASYGDVIPYDLGQGTLEDWDGWRSVPYTINGSMAIPDKLDCPVVIFVNGNAPMGAAADARYDLGFSYLMKALVAQGYACFSVNMNMAYSFENGEPDEAARMEQIMTDQLGRILKAGDGDNEGFPISLEGRLDPQQITLIGHSRGGYGIFQMAYAVKTLGGNINGLLAVAPAVNFVSGTAYPDVPTAIITPSQDNDVSMMDGQKLYDALHDDPTRVSDTQLVYLFGANHNAFNQAMLHQDNRLYNQDPALCVPITPPDEQREVYTSYILDFVNAVNNGGSLSGLPNNLNGDFYGASVLTSFSGGNKQTLFQAGGADAAVFTASGGAAGKDVTGSFMLNKNTAGYMNFPGAPMSLPLWQLSWQSAGAKASLPAAADASGYRALVIDLAQDSTSGLNDQADQAMEVTLTDASGGAGQVGLPAGTAALAHRPGSVEEIPGFDGPIGKLYSDFTPLSSVVLPLSDFSGVDLSALSGLTLTFPAAQGCVVIRSVSLVR